ncbi:MAG TPA: Gfo/Idh/MocA family oxidoreductase [Candidatus Acidoferrum sp.]|jgi:myo-inositol 2-dehydrogenase/D-chiro-inositol 1-dehydrogenase|nr:Gfo/Idh/MocA family oxidoreductase [Candidatus Acidoferrum sp.]
MPHKIGIIGAGGVAGIHAAILAKDSRVELHSFFDVQPDRARALASRFGGSAAESVDELLEKCDAAFVCTPNTTHEEVSTKVLDAGRHVFCEKPFALDLASAARLRDRAERSGLVYQVGHNRRFAPVYKILKDTIDRNDLRPLSVHAKMNRGELTNPPWVWNRRLTGGFLYETPVHMFDLMTYFFGPVKSVHVAARAHQHDELDDFSILLTFQSGLQATMKTYAHASWHFPFERFEVYGMHSTYETFEMEKISFTNGLESRTTTFDFSLASMHEKWGYIEEDRLFVDALDGKSPAPVTAEDGYRVVELIEACYQSARDGARVHLGDPVGRH